MNSRTMMKQKNEIPRRAYVQKRFKFETKISDLIDEIESLGAHPELTNVIVHLQDAFDAIADWYDVGGPVLVPPDSEEEPSGHLHPIVDELAERNFVRINDPRLAK